MLTCRGLIAGVASLIAAPAIVRASSLMTVKSFLWFDRSEWESLVPSNRLAWRNRRTGQIITIWEAVDQHHPLVRVPLLV